MKWASSESQPKVISQLSPPKYFNQSHHTKATKVAKSLKQSEYILYLCDRSDLCVSSVDTPIRYRAARFAYPIHQSQRWPPPPNAKRRTPNSEFLNQSHHTKATKVAKSLKQSEYILYLRDRGDLCVSSIDTPIRFYRAARFAHPIHQSQRWPARRTPNAKRRTPNSKRQTVNLPL